MLRGGGWSDFKVANATGIFGCDCDVERGPGVGRGGRFFELGEAAAHDDAEDDHLGRDALCIRHRQSHQLLRSQRGKVTLTVNMTYNESHKMDDGCSIPSVIKNATPKSVYGSADSTISATAPVYLLETCSPSSTPISRAWCRRRRQMSEETVMLSAMTTQEYASAKCLLVPKKKFAFGSPVITLVATPRPVGGREGGGRHEADG